MLEYLDEIAAEAWEGEYERVGPLSTGERLYVALASGRMSELAPSDSIAYAVNRVGDEWMAHMLKAWGTRSQPISSRHSVAQQGIANARSSAVTVTDDMVHAALRVQNPTLYGQHLRHPANGPKTREATEREIEATRKMIAAAMEVLPRTPV